MSRLSFSQFLRENEDTVYFTFGRMNPPTAGHEKLLNNLREKAGRKPYRIYLSQSNDQKKNPLIYEDKVKIVRKMFPQHGRSVKYDTSVKNILEAASALYDDGFKNIVMVCGSDRLVEFKERLNLYNGKEGRHGFYVFESIKVISGGHRDPDAKDVEGISASTLREAAQNSDFVKFAQGLPKSTSNEDSKSLYNKVRIGFGLNEEKSFRNHIKVGKTTPIREKYINGELFEVGDDVVIKENQELAKVVILGSNYVIVETNDGKRKRKWLNDVEKL